MDTLLPALNIHDTSLPAERQQCVLAASKAAKAQKGRGQVCPRDDGMRDPKTAFDEAKSRCGVPRPTEAQYLGQLVLTFGRYTGRTFKWLVENDVGYVKYLVDRHVKESQRPEKRGINEEWLKDSLLKYVELFPPISCHLERNVDRAIYGMGRFRSFTFLEMWQWYKCHIADPKAGSEQERRMAQEAHTSVKQWLLMRESDITSKSLKRFRQYILDKENATPPAAAAATSRAPAAAATSHVPWSDDAPDDTALVDALATFESHGEPISTSQPPVSAGGPEQPPPLSTNVPASPEKSASKQQKPLQKPLPSSPPSTRL
ncbi:uncharacterized protein LOC131988962 [Centropristis striata]|uniref:uncharacterized protein LOC131988962 n=1 Tax=Centropristis striata TaxID=184440 RepID=UPI0027E1F7F6|nr:uncharacterized protein LOC131988962 [Centropristis striata]